MRRVLIGGAIALALVVLVLGAYAAYVFTRWYRLPDGIELTIEKAPAPTAVAQSGVEYTIASYNLGFGAYSADFGFFMDGGAESRGSSASEVRANVAGALEVINGADCDLALLQEVDVAGDRSHDVNEFEMARAALSGMDCVFAQNYDSPYFLYPLTHPMGSAKSGIVTASKFEITSSIRRSLPIQSGVMKIIDLDRCYSVSRINVDNGRELVVYNAHLSAYSSDETVVPRQMQMLFEDIKAEYEAGNYVVCGGDFNCDLLGDSGAIFGVPGKGYTWARPFDDKALPAGLRLIAPIDYEAPIASARNADGPYVKGETFEITLDGFIVSENVRVHAAGVSDTGFSFSDHQMVYMRFELMQYE